MFTRPLPLSRWLGPAAIPVALVIGGCAGQDAKLFRATTGGDAAGAVAAVRSGADVDTTDAISGWTPLMLAASRDDVATVRALLAAGADPDAVSVPGTDWQLTASSVPDWRKPAFGATALMIASTAQHWQVVQALLEAGADPAIAQKDGTTPLHLAAAAGRDDLVRTLVKNGAPLDAVRRKRATTPLLMALGGKQADTALLLLASGADATIPTADGESPLSLGVRLKDRSDVVESLLAHGADPARADADGRTPLVQAVLVNNAGAVKALIEGGANPAAADAEGLTPMLVAAGQRRTRAVRALCDKGVDPDVAGPGGVTPLIAAAAAGDPSTTRWLMRCGADSEAAASDGRTALLAAVASGSVDTVAALLRAGAVSSASARRLAERQRRPDILTALSSSQPSERASTDDAT